jgi:hypothetical protein
VVAVVAEVGVVRRLVVVVFGLGLLASCGGGGDSGVSATTAAAPPTTSTPSTTEEVIPASSTTASAPTTSAAPATTAAASAELPAFMNEFDRVCKTQVGFSGATAYDGAPGTHPVALLEDAFEDDDLYIESSNQLPAGWTIEQDSDFADNSELAAVQLVACLDRTATAPTGTQCEFDNNGTKITLELTNATYELKVFGAVTGEAVGNTSITTTETECPFIAVFREGDTQHIASLSDDDLTNALKPYVTPA